MNKNIILTAAAGLLLFTSSCGLFKGGKHGERCPAYGKAAAEKGKEIHASVTTSVERI
jgi:hypothetical protein